jgi:hypothetical protein
MREGERQHVHGEDGTGEPGSLARQEFGLTAGRARGPLRRRKIQSARNRDRSWAINGNVVAANTIFAANGRTRMRNRLFTKLALLLVLALGSTLISPLRYAFTGFLRHEHFFKHRPTSYWLKIIHDDDVRYRRWSARALSHLGGEPEVVAALAAALKDKDAEVHYQAVLSLGAIGPAAKKAVPALTEALKKSDDSIRPLIEEALWKIGTGS